MAQAAQQLETREDGPLIKLFPDSVFNPLDYSICARAPMRHGVPSAWIGHIPFAMGLVAMIKPRVLVELGAHSGVSYCAFCQAVKEMRLDTRCYAVDTWEGDPHSSFYGREVLADLRAHHDPAYALFSELIQSSFDDALPRFQDKSIDLLHLDGYHSYEAVKHDFETWLPKLSDRGIILLHDIEVRDDETFGAWRFWDEIKKHYPHFEFYHAFGLGIIAVGQSVPEALRPVLGATWALADRVREYFQNLGDRLDALYSTALQKNNLQELLHAKTDECTQTQDLLDAKAEECIRTQAELKETRRALELTLEELHIKYDNIRDLCCQRDAVLVQLRSKVAESLVIEARLLLLWTELAAMHQHFGRLRFRAVEKVAEQLKRLPALYRVLKFMAHQGAALWRRLR